jgi:hypothetical protein
LCQQMNAAPTGTLHSCAPAAREVGIACKVGFLSSPQVYADRPARVETVETHFSWVFLTDRYVYKLKKPLCSDGIDLSTVQARQRNAEAEVRLNRRLAADDYLGVMPLTLAADGVLTVGGKGFVTDWLVPKWSAFPPSVCWTADLPLVTGIVLISMHSPAFLRSSLRRPSACRWSLWPISAASALNAGRDNVLFAAAAVPRCNLPSTALCATLRPLSAVIAACWCNAWAIAGSSRDMAISAPSISVWALRRGLSIASNSDTICAVSTR